MKGGEKMADFETNAKLKDNGKYGCPNCESEEFKRIAHIDGKNFFMNQYNCVKCGTPVSTKHKRSKESQMYWE